MCEKAAIKFLACQKPRLPEEIPSVIETIVHFLRKNNVSELVLHLYNRKASKEFQIVPGLDLCIAYDEAMKYGGSERALVNERDEYMCSKLLEAARESTSVVAVVGGANVPGIIKIWMDENSSDL
ncbi:hypothetical protein KI387_021809, partial [Taxus chinensis]